MLTTIKIINISVIRSDFNEDNVGSRQEILSDRRKRTEVKSYGPISV